jgi:TolB-like protein
MFTDIVGYSAITQRDESLALSLLDEHNKLMREVIAKHNGSVVKTVGDAFLAEFASALDAVKAAMAAQTALRARNAIASGEPIRIRIGIHLGDVIYRDGDVFGDGVNIAARVQSVAPAEGVCISADVAGQVENKIDAPLISLGTPKLKNIERPIPVFAVQMPWMLNANQTGHARAKGKGSWKGWVAAVSVVVVLAAGAAWFMRGATPPPVQLSLAVLPFADLSQARDQEYLGDGLAEEILNQLAQVPSLRLVGRTSSFSFKGKNEDLRIIGQKLGVANLLEGSVRKDGNQLRITAQLIRADDGTHLWSKTYAREFKDVFAVQDEIAREVATALSVKLEAGVLTRAAGGTTNTEAYEKLLRAREEHGRSGREGAAKSAQLLREAVELDPDFGAAWVARAWVLYQMGWSPEIIAASSREIADILARNVRAAPNAPWTLQLQGQDHLSHYRWADAATALQAVQATPYGARRTVDAFTNPPIYLKWSSLHSTGHLREGAQMGIDWVRVDPLSAEASFANTMWLMYVGRDEDALAEYKRAKSLGLASEWPMLTRQLRAANIDLAALKAQFVAGGVEKEKPDSLQRQIFDALGKADALRAVLKNALEAPAPAVETLANVAVFADGFGERDLALAAIRKDAVTPHARNPHRIGTLLWYPYKTQLRKDPRFKEIVREIGLVDYWRKSGNWGDFCKPLGNDDFECR